MNDQLNHIYITWAQKYFHYTYVNEHMSGVEVSYRVTYASGSFVLIRDLKTDAWWQQPPLQNGNIKLPQNFIDIVGKEILKDQRPKQRP